MDISLFRITIIINPKLTPISKNQDPKFKTVPGVEHIQAIASKAGIIRTETAFEGIILKELVLITSGII
jgi:hypothetical protein